MKVQVVRNGVEVGTFTAPALMEQLQARNVLPTDLARCDGIDEWLPVA